MKKVLLVVAVAILIFAGCGKKSSSSSDSSTTSTSKAASSDSKASESLDKLLNNGKPKHCTVSASFGGVTSKGTVYTNGKGSSHAIYSVKHGNEKIESNVIVKGDTEYLWVNSGGTAIGYSINLKDPKVNSEALKNIGGIDPSQTMDMDCNSWSVDSSKFEVPADVSFTDFTSLYSTNPMGE